MILPGPFTQALRQLLGPENVADAPETLVCYSLDAMNEPAPEGPELVVFPPDEAAVAGVMALCHRHRIPVTPRGAGVGMTGGCVPACGGIVMAMTRLNRILEIDSDNLVAVVEPGVVTQHLQDAVKPLGLFYPPDPASANTSTLGGNVAECAGGLSAVKYGVTKHYVLGARFVLPDGTVCAAGGKMVKNVVGYDLLGLLVGSEGTLAVITQLTLKLLPLPEVRRTLLVAFASVEDAGAAVAGIIRARIVPTALELMDRPSIRAVEDVLHYGIPTDAEALLLVEIDGKPGDVEADFIRLLDQVKAHGGHIALEAADAAQRERIWEFRRTISPAITCLKSLKINEDIVVPRSEMPRILRRIEEIAARFQVTVVCYGHAGDGNLHVNLLAERQDRDEVKRALAAVEEIFKASVALGGAISGEHGIGLAKKRYIRYNLSPDVLALTRRIKQAFDPAGILNPGKIFPDES